MPICAGWPRSLSGQDETNDVLFSRCGVTPEAALYEQPVGARLDLAAGVVARMA